MKSGEVEEDDSVITVSWIEEWRNELTIDNNDNNKQIIQPPPQSSSNKYNSFLEKIILLESNSNLNNILKLNENNNNNNNKSKTTDNNNNSSSSSSTSTKYVRNSSSGSSISSNKNEVMVYITSPLSNESLESTEEYCFFLVNLPVSKKLIFNQFSCLLIHLFQIEFNNNILINNATTSSSSSSSSNNSYRLNNNNYYNNNYNNNYNSNYNNNNYNYNNRYNNNYNNYNNYNNNYNSNYNNQYNSNYNNPYNYNNSNSNYNSNSSNNLKVKDLEGYKDCSNLKKLTLTIHDYLIQLLQRNSIWYDSILEWSLSTITTITKLLKILKIQQQQQSKNKLHQQQQSISILVKERLEYYSFKSLLSLVLHLTRELPIEKFIEKSKTEQFLKSSGSTTSPYELGWILCHLGKKNPSLILDLVFKHSLNNIENGRSSSSSNINSSQDIDCFQILEFLAIQPSSYLSIIFQQHIEKIITNHHNNNSSQFIKEIKTFLILLSKDDSFLTISLPNILDQFSPFGINEFDKINNSNNNSSSNNNNNNSNKESMIEKDIIEINKILEKILLGNSQVIAFHSKKIVLALYYCCYGSTNSNKTRFSISSKLLDSIIKDKLEKQLFVKLYSLNSTSTTTNIDQQQQQQIYDNSFISNLNHHENIIFYLNQIQIFEQENDSRNSSSSIIEEKNNLILNLVCLIGIDSIHSSIIILTFIICKLKSSKQFINYFYKLIELFQMVNSNTIEYFINDLFKSIDSFSKDDLVRLLNNLLVLVKTIPNNNSSSSSSNNSSSSSSSGSTTTCLVNFYNIILNSISSNWVILLKLIRHPSLIDSNKILSMDILYHSFKNRFNGSNSSGGSSSSSGKSIQQQLKIEGSTTTTVAATTTVANGKQSIDSSSIYLSDKEILEIRILLEKILHLIFKNLRYLEEKNSLDKEVIRLKKFENYKNLYLLICNGSLFYFSITIDMLFDYLFSTNTDMIIKLPTLCPLSPANSLPPPNYPANLEDNSNSDSDHHHHHQSSNGNNEDGSSNSSINNIISNGFIINEKEELYFQQIINPSLPLSQPLIMLPMQSSLLETNYERKHYHYKFNDMNNPNHIPFTNKPKNVKKRIDQNDENAHVDDNSIRNATTSSNNIKKKRIQKSKDTDQIMNIDKDIGDEEYENITDSIKSLDFNLLNNQIDLQSFIKSMILNDDASSISNSTTIEDRLQILTDQFLLRVTCSYPEPTYENYLEILPKQSHYERDIFIRNLFQQNPFLYHVLELISMDARQLIRCLEVIKSLLVNDISYWYQCRNTFSESPIKSPHYQITVQLVRALINSQFIIHPLNLSLELFDKIKADEISYILTSIWNFIKDYQPEISQYKSTTTTNTINQQQQSPIFESKREIQNCNTSPYSLTLKSIFHNHIKEFCYHYARFFPKKYE